MVSERAVRVFHPILFVLITIAGIISLAISASLVKHYNDTAYPSTSIRDRVRLLLVASIWTVLFGLYLLIGVLVNSGHILFGICSHLFTLTVSFLLFLIGAAALTSSVDKHSCDVLNFSRCNIVKGLVAISWIETIFVFIALLAVFGLGIKSRSGAGMRRSTLLDA
ncbi:hypothetical protein MNV49_007947 [Pseudohyphozyma bogoriensis]|nr:hypothetical protein MNV49_007947 [Pseudohyphozyma bogoriensis]